VADQPDGRLAVGPAVALITPIASALVELHARGILHRDLKPANIVRYVRADGHASVKLVDFGIARREQDAGLTGEGLIVGTPPYLSPEVMLGKRHSEASDVYALGATLFELLTGTPPFGKDSVHDVMKRTVTESVKLPPYLEHTAVGELLLDLLDRNEARRPSALAALGQLERLELEQARQSVTPALPVAPTPVEGPGRAEIAGAKTIPQTPTALVKRVSDTPPSPATGPDATAPVANRSPAAGGRAGRSAFVPWAITLGTVTGALVMALYFGLRETPTARAPVEPTVDSGTIPDRRVPRPVGTRRPDPKPVAPTMEAPAVDKPGPDANAAPLPDLPPGPGLSTAHLARARKRCTNAPDALALFNELSKQYKFKGYAPWVKAGFTVILRCPYANAGQKRWSALRLSRVYLREGSCAAARVTWERYEALARAAGKNPGPLPKCPP
jgi:hypothetical protein